jgi:hypothetical protein
MRPLYHAPSCSITKLCTHVPCHTAGQMDGCRFFVQQPNTPVCTYNMHTRDCTRHARHAYSTSSILPCSLSKLCSYSLTTDQHIQLAAIISVDVAAHPCTQDTATPLGLKWNVIKCPDTHVLKGWHASSINRSTSTCSITAPANKIA